jgi:hypothetical protein
MIRGRISNFSILINSSPGYDTSITASELNFKGRKINPAEEEQ